MGRGISEKPQRPGEDQGSDEEERVLARQEGFEAITPWLGWVFGPMAWALHQGVGYAMVPTLCRMQERWPYHLLTVIALLLGSAGVWAGLRALRRSKRVRPERSAARMRMMGAVGLMLCAASFGGIILEYTGSFFLDLCASVARPFV